MSSQFNQFDQYKLSTELYNDYCIHTITCKTGPGERSEKWNKGKILGEGAFGTVWLEEEEKKGTLRAVKQISKTNVLVGSGELLALSTLKAYPDLFVQLFGWFETDRYIFLAMEYIEHGDLAKLINESNMTESDAKVITRQLLEGLKVMHENNFCHRDLKPMNILVASRSPIVVKISDFGITKQTDDKTALRTTVGTFAYTAPEVLSYLSSETSEYTSAVDIWSLGCVTHAIITKKTPFPHARKLMEYIGGRISFPKTKLMENDASSYAIKFITSLMEVQPKDRLTAEQALRAPWLNTDVGKEEDTFWEKIEGPTDPGLGRDKSVTGQDIKHFGKYLDTKDLHHFSSSCLQLFDSLKIWCNKFSNFSAGRKCVHVHRIVDEASKDRIEDVMLDDRGVRRMLKDETKRSDVFLAIVMRMIWELVFTRYLFGLGTDERQKLLSLEKTLAERGEAEAIHQWRAITLVLLSATPTFGAKRVAEAEEVTNAIFRLLSYLLPPPPQHASLALGSLRNLVQHAVQLAIEMRTQRAEYVMKRPPQPEYDDNGDTTNVIPFIASVMQNRGTEPALDKELEVEGATVKLILFPHVIRRGNEYGENYNTEFTILPMQVLVNRPEASHISAGPALRDE